MLSTVALAAVMMWVSTSSLAVHPNGMLYAALPIDRDTALNNVNDLTVVRNGNGLRLFECIRKVLKFDDAAGDAGGTSTVHRRNMRTRKTDKCVGDLQAGGSFGFFQRSV